MRKIVLLSFLILFCFYSHAQQNDSTVIRKIYTDCLQNGKAYDWLKELTEEIGGRLTGSPEAEKAVDWAKKKMKEAGADTVWLQEVIVPKWVRGEKEIGKLIFANGTNQDVPITALGNSVATSTAGVTAKIIEVDNFDDLKKLGKEKIEGKIVFYNHPMDQSMVNTFDAYSDGVVYRWNGPSEAARYGAVATICRSLSTTLDDHPHTGAMHYNDSLPKIPCCAISTNAAEMLSKRLKQEELSFYLKMNCEMKDSVKSHNVIGEIKGSKFPGEYIVVTGHLDSWDLAKGAHDDGAGVVQSIEVIRILKSLNIHPEKTIRAIAYMNEENGLRGGKTYAAEAKAKNEKHIAAIESDAGGFLPLGFGLDMKDAEKKSIQRWSPLFLPYGVYDFSHEGDGADISPLVNMEVPLIGLEVNSQRYFEYHHSEIDTFDKVDKRELHLGAATMAAMCYLLSEYGLQ